MSDDVGVVLNKGYQLPQSHAQIAEARGSRITDVNGIEYIDTVLGCGTAILGHSPSVVVDALTEQLQRGTSYSLPSVHAAEYGALLKSVMPWNDHFVFCNSGSEATMRAIRIARAATGKPKIGIFSGGWHGSHDMVLMEEAPGSEEANPQVKLLSRGTPSNLMDEIVYLPYNHSNAFSLIEENASELALVLVEPIQGSNPRDDIGPFLMELRKVTREYDVLLGLDEVITGGRLGLGGGQEYFDVYADLATYGKILGGGLPIGIVGGSDKVMHVVSNKKAEGSLEPVFMGGTFSGNPLATVAGHATLSYLRNNTEEVYGKLRKQGEYLRASVNQFCKEHSIKASMIGAQSVSRIVFSDRPIKSRHQRSKYEWDYCEQSAFFEFVKERGVLIGST